jgi:hypothetical protein
VAGVVGAAAAIVFGLIPLLQRRGVLAALADVAAGLGLGAGEGDVAAAGRAVRHRLETDGDRCLLVFDNATDAAVLRPFLPAAGAARVLITSRCLPRPRRWPSWLSGPSPDLSWPGTGVPSAATSPPAVRPCSVNGRWFRGT